MRSASLPNNKMEYILYAFILLIYNVADVFSYVCSEKRYTYGYIYFSCTYGCCGTTYNKYCCSSSSYSYHSTRYLSTGAAAAIGICIVCFFIAVILAAVCYKKKYHGRVLRAGQVGQMGTVQVTHTTMVSGPGPQPYPVYPPPAYAQRNMHPPPPPGQINAGPSHPGYIPPPPAYSAPPLEFGAPPPSYIQAQNGKY